MNTKVGSEPQSPWKTYGTYRLVILVWVLNDTTVVFSATNISHKAFFIHILIHILTIIFIGIPLLYSEICLAQYTNCTITSMWNYFPLFRSIGYGEIYLIFLKALFQLALTSWHLEYAFFAALDPPPWFSCDDFNDTKCMVKRVNVSVFQHCLEAQNIFDDDCGMKTASNCFFEREIGENNTLETKSCYYGQWKAIIALVSTGFALFIFTVKRDQLIKMLMKLAIIYLSLVIFVLLCVALSTNGSWYASKISINWSSYGFTQCTDSMVDAFLTLGTGTGMLVFLSRDVPFRSPATMTSIAVSLFSMFVTIILALIIFSGIKTMSYFHGEEENVIELGDSSRFNQFASVSEILSYFNNMPIWALLYFSMAFWSLLINLWMSFLFLNELFIANITLAQKYHNTSCFLLAFFLCMLTCPFLCSDLNDALLDATDLIQLLNSFFFSISLYWIYGFNNHNVDIIFMIGVKASYYWKVTWILNPIFLMTLIYAQWFSLEVALYEDSRIIDEIELEIDLFIYYALLILYSCIIVIGMIMEIISFYRYDNIRNIFFPSTDWGPRDKVLYKSRQVFVPQIMTTEFLYRQVRIHGYGKRERRVSRKQSVEQFSEDSLSEKMEWSALTSN